MKFLHPNEILAQAMTNSIAVHIESEHMVAVSVEQIMADLESWFVAIGCNESLAGFFCLRRPHPHYAEMGSVKSMQGVLPQLVQKFENQRQIEGQIYGCAITKDHPEKFVQLTQGKVLSSFPPWYDRIQSDKHFVQWE